MPTPNELRRWAERIREEVDEDAEATTESRAATLLALADLVKDLETGTLERFRRQLKDAWRAQSQLQKENDALRTRLSVPNSEESGLCLALPRTSGMRCTLPKDHREPHVWENE